MVDARSGPKREIPDSRAEGLQGVGKGSEALPAKTLRPCHHGRGTGQANQDAHSGTDPVPVEGQLQKPRSADQYGKDADAVQKLRSDAVLERLRAPARGLPTPSPPQGAAWGSAWEAVWGAAPGTICPLLRHRRGGTHGFEGALEQSHAGRERGQSLVELAVGGHKKQLRPSDLGLCPNKAHGTRERAVGLPSPCSRFHRRQEDRERQNDAYPRPSAQVMKTIAPLVAAAKRPNCVLATGL